jgi:hypothetical protein
MRTRLITFCLLLACGTPVDKNGDGIADGVKSPDTVQQVAPSTPIGTISGVVVKADNTPLDMVDVVAVVGGQMTPDMMAFKTQSKPDGSFFFQGVPAGAQVELTLSKMAFTTARINVTVPAAAGTVPLDNGNANAGIIQLVDIGSPLTFQLIRADGAPADTATAVIEVSPVASWSGLPNGAMSVSATVDMGGIATFTGTPDTREEISLNAQYTVTVSGIDVDADKVPDFLGLRKTFSAADLYTGAASRVLVLPSAHATTPITILTSNVDTAITGVPSDPVKNMVHPGDPIYFVFDQRALTGSLDLKITDESGLTPVMTTLTWNSPYNNVLKVTASSTIEQGMEYNIALRVTSAENGTQLARTAYFFGADPGTPKMFAVAKVSFKKGGMNAASQLEPGDTVVVTFNQPIKNIYDPSNRVDFTFSYDITQNNSQNDPGEVGDTKDASPFVLAAVEPVAEPGFTFVNLPSGYTTRYEFGYGGMVSVPLNTAVQVRFARTGQTLGAYRTIWDAPVDADVSSTISAP